jgi:glycosyltransferase involved in cell wall biosynthesis
MRVLLVNDSAAELGGAEIMTHFIREELRSRGHEVRLFAAATHPGHSADDTCFGASGTRVQTLIRTANPSAYRRLRAVLEGFRPDVVHVRMFLTQLSPLILPLLRDIPSVYHAVMYEAVCPMGTKLLPDDTRCTHPAGWICHTAGCLPLRAWMPLMLQQRLWRRWRGAFDQVIANSEAMRAELLAAGIGPVQVIPNGVPVTPEPPPLARTPTAVFAGRLVREKGAEVLARAFVPVAEALPEARLTIAGEGPEQDRIRAVVQRHRIGDRVLLAGKIPRENLDRTFGGAWVQVVPSLWDEPFGIAAAEALMRGTPVVASDVGGLPEIVSDGESGLLVPPDDADALGRALLSLLGDRQRVESMGRAGRRDAMARFAISRLVDSLLRIYGEIGVRSESGGRRDGRG